MRSLYGVTLPEAIEWANRESTMQVARDFVRTASGGMRYFSTPLTAGRKIILKADPKYCWAMKDDRDALEAIVNSLSPGAFVWGDYSANVLVESWALERLLPEALDASGTDGVESIYDIWHGEINLITV